MTDMTCREFVDFLMSYVDQTLPMEQRETFEGHMQLCPTCVTYLDTYKDTVLLGRAVCRDPEGPPPEEAPEQLVKAILAARERG